MDLLDTGAALVTAALLVLAGLGATSVGRLLLAVVFVTFVPGWAALDYLPLAENAARVALAVALSLSFCILATALVVWLHFWHPRLLLDIAGIGCLLALVWHLAHPDGSASDHPPSTRTPVSAARPQR
ncbi:MAG: hypothetical protein ACYDAD_05370 [Acidimicrobiales bacterium]